MDVENAHKSVESVVFSFAKRAHVGCSPSVEHQRANLIGHGSELPANFSRYAPFATQKLLMLAVPKIKKYKQSSKESQNHRKSY